MKKKINCWEFMKCGREPGGKRAEECGVCPAATYTPAHGVNKGINGGRMCWAIVGIYSFEEKECAPSRRDFHCYDCDFHWKVLVEEGIIKEENVKKK